MQEDKAGKKYWNSIYQGSANNVENWIPITQAQEELDKIFSNSIQNLDLDAILEFGCGGSQWLPYLCEKHNVLPYGVDYSPLGVKSCRLNCVRRGFDATNIVLHDLYKQPIFKSKFGFSIGLVEHFSNLDDCIFHLGKYIEKEGILFTQVPNINNRSILGKVVRFYQPDVYDIHVPITLAKLVTSYESNNIEILENGYLGIPSFSPIAYNSNVRFPKLNFIIRPLLKLLNKLLELAGTLRLINRGDKYSPYIYIVGKKVS